MSDREPFVHLPDQITLTLQEIAVVLAALDVADETGEEADRKVVRRAIRMVTSKLWPELGGLLDDDEG